MTDHVLNFSVAMTLNGSEVQLVPSLRACSELSRKYGGLLPLMDVLNLGSLDAATDVCFWALSKKDSERDELREHVYAAGLRYVAPKLVEFMIRLMNGGRLPPAPAPVA